MTLFKWLASFVLTLILLVALAIVVLPRVIDPNDYRDKITSLVKDKTGRDLSLTGDLSISIFPWLGIRTQGLSFSQPDEIGGEMLSVKTAQLRVKLLPLLKKQVEVDTVVLENPQVRLITLKNGDNSFMGLIGEATKTDSAQDDNDAAAAVALVIQGLEISDGDLLWDDQQAGQSYQVKDLNVLSGNLIGSDLADLSASGTLIDGSAPQPIAFELNGKARIDTEALKFLGQNLHAQVHQGEQQAQFSLGDVEVDPSNTARLKNIELNATMAIAAADDVDGTTSKSQPASVIASIEDVNFDFNSGQLSALGTDAKIKASLSEQPPLDADLSLPNLTFNTTTGEILANVLAIDGQFGDRKFTLDTPQLAANLTKQLANLDSLVVNSDDLALSLEDLRISQFIDQPSASGKIKMQPFNAAKLLQDLAIEYNPAEKTALQSVEFSSAFEAGLDSVSLQNMQLNLDQSKLTGAFEAKDFANLAIKFKLVLDQLNLDHYLPQSEEAKATETADTANATALAAPMAILKDINANGSFKANQLTSGGLKLTDIDVLVASSPGNLIITPKAKLYDGSLGGKMAFTASGDQSTLTVDNKIDLVSLAKFLTAADVSEQLSGIGSLDLDIEVTERDGVQSNSGTIKLLAKNGAIQGVDIKSIVDQGYQTYNSLSGKDRESSKGEGETGKTNSSDETRFAELLGTFHLKDNKLRNDDFLMKAPLFRIAGEGDIDLAAQTLNYLINVSIVNSSDGQGGKTLDQLKGLTIPIRFRGSLTSPSYTLDTKALYRSLAKRKVDEKKSEYLQEKLGIEGAGEMSTKDLLQEALRKKANEKLGIEEPADTSIAQPDVAPADATQPDVAQPDSPTQSSEVPDVSAETNAVAEPKKSAKDQLKDDLKERLLDSIFN